MKLLMVGDSDLIRGRLANLLPRLGRVDTAEALAQTLRSRSAHELAVLDPRLSGGNAMQIDPDLKRMAPQMRIAGLTNVASPLSGTRCCRLGADWFFDKSTEFEQLLALVRHQATLQ